MYTYVHLYIYIHRICIYVYMYLCCMWLPNWFHPVDLSIRHIWSLGDATLRCEPTKSWVDLEGYHGYTVILE